MITHRCLFFAAGIALVLSGCNSRHTDDTLSDSAPDAASAAKTPPPMPETQSTSATTTPVAGTDASAPPQGAGSAVQLAVGATPGPTGPYVTDAAGGALYMLEGDTDGSKCTGACLRAWPPLLATDAQPSAGTGLAASDVATIRRADGALQVAYAGHPLHHYAADAGAGHTAGHGVKDQWGSWSLVPVKAAAPAKQ